MVFGVYIRESTFCFWMNLSHQHLKTNILPKYSYLSVSEIEQEVDGSDAN